MTKKIHHRRKPKKPLTTHGTYCRIATIRLPYGLERAIKEVAETRGRPWQTVLKELLEEALGLSNGVEIKRVSSKNLQAAAKRLRNG